MSLDNHKDFERDTSIFLVGMMGTGKSSMGKKLANRIDYQFIDLDREIETKMNVPIKMIFELEGEAGFRIRETDALKKVAKLKKRVVATGGGVITTEANREILKEKYCIYLRSSIDRIFNRTRFSQNHRPLLESVEESKRMEFIENLINERDPYYREVANRFMTQKGDRNKALDSLIRIVQRDLHC